jgi:hypothetical protein
VGNTTYATIAFFVCAAGIGAAFRSEPPMALGAIGLLIIPYLVYIVGTWRFADKHPDRAMLGDSEWLRHQELQFAALGYGPVPYTAPRSPTIDEMPTEPGAI